MNWVAMGWGFMNAVITVALYKYHSPEWALGNVAYLATLHGYTFRK